MTSEFTRDEDGALTWHCLPFEVGLMEAMAGQLVELVDAPEWSEDPLERWANEREAAPLDRDDPAIVRLFPDASSDETEASEFRRLMEAELRTQKALEAGLVVAALQPAIGEADPTVRIEPDEIPAWLRTVNAMRLVLGARLGIESAEDADRVDEIDDSDERAPTADVYQWLGYVQLSMLDVM